MHAAVIEDQDREALRTLERMAMFSAKPEEHEALVCACSALRSLIETRERIAWRLRTAEFND